MLFPSRGVSRNVLKEILDPGLTVAWYIMAPGPPIPAPAMTSSSSNNAWGFTHSSKGQASSSGVCQLRQRLVESRSGDDQRHTEVVPMQQD